VTEQVIDRSGCPAGPGGEHGTLQAYYRDSRSPLPHCRCADAREASRLYRKRLRHGRDDVRGKVSPLGSRRRIAALNAIGWRYRDLVAHSSLGLGHLTRIATGKHRVILRATHDEIARLFDELQHTAGPSAETRKRARARGLVDPAGWDGIDIDDPAAVPDTIPYTVKPVRSRAIDLDRVEELRGWGLDLEFIARELGVKPVSIRQAVWLQRVRNEKETDEELELVSPA
jgi:hypothetical protein